MPLRATWGPPLNADGTPDEEADWVQSWIEDEVTGMEVAQPANVAAVVPASDALQPRGVVSGTRTAADVDHHNSLILSGYRAKQDQSSRAVMQPPETFPDVDPQNSQTLSVYHAKQVALHLEIPLQLVHALVETAEKQGNEFSHLSQCDRGVKLQAWWTTVQKGLDKATEKKLVESCKTVMGVVPDLDFKFSKSEVLALYLTNKGRMDVVTKNLHKILENVLRVKQFYKDFLQDQEGTEYCPVTMKRVAIQLSDIYPCDYDLFNSVHGPLTVLPAVHALILLSLDEGQEDPYILGSLHLNIVYDCVKLWLGTTKRTELFSKAKALLGHITAKTTQKSAKGKGKGKRAREDADVGKPGSSLGFKYDVVRAGTLQKEAKLQDQRRKKSQFDEDLSLSTRLSLNARDEEEGRGKQSQDKPYAYRTPSPEVPAEQEELEGNNLPRRRRGGGGSEGGGGGGAGGPAGARGSRDEGGSRAGGSA